MTVQNRIENDEAYKSTYPELKGRNLPAIHELHVFLSELNPKEERVQEYYNAVDEWNNEHPNLKHKMKACYLGLVFRNPNGEEKVVKVMQSARYFRSDDMDLTVKQVHEDADFFAKRGFSVVREKIEATAYSIDGIPQTDEEAKQYDTKYFEFHIKVGNEEKKPLTDEEIESLKKISRTFTAQFKAPVPLSYNCNQDGVTKGDGLGSQRFLNVRFRHVGMETIDPKLKEIKAEIAKTGLKVLKVISEYVWYDSFNKLDHGWIDYSDEELNTLLK